MSWGPLVLTKYKDEQFHVVWYLWYTVHIDMHDQLLISSMSIPRLDFISWIFRPFKLRNNAHCSNFVCISPSATRNVLWCLSALAFGSTCSQILVFCWLPCDGWLNLLVTCFFWRSEQKLNGTTDQDMRVEQKVHERGFLCVSLWVCN